MKHKRVWIFAALLLSVFLLNYIFGWSSYLGDMKNLEFLKRAVQEHLIGAVLLYMVVTVVGSVVLALPGVTFAILAGILFGPVLGTIACSLATTLGAVLAFLAGRFFLKDTIKPMVIKNKYLKKWLFSESKQNELFVLMITRLIPVFPYNLQNFAYGITDMRFRVYVLGSLLFMLPGTAMYTVGAAGVADSQNRGLYIGIALGLAVLVIGVGALFKKRYIQNEGGVASDEGEI